MKLQLHSVPSEDVADLLDQDLPGSFEPCECGYPIYWAYNITPESGFSDEREWFEPWGVTRENRLQELHICPCCKKDLATSES